MAANQMQWSRVEVGSVIKFLRIQFHCLNGILLFMGYLMPIQFSEKNGSDAI